MFDWPVAIITFLVTEYLGTLVFSMYCHRQLAHRHWTLHPYLSNFCRFYIWLISGFGHWPNWQQHYAAQHRKHHLYSDVHGDPHSPIVYSAGQLFLNTSNIKPGGPFYLSASEIENYASDIVSDRSWMETHVYKHRHLGKFIYAGLLTLLFGWVGLICGIINFLLIEYYAVLIGDYIVHKWGTIPSTRDTPDQSKNSYPWCFFMAGEELHANHHDNPGNPNNARHWYEIDATYTVAVLLSKFGLVKFN